MNEKEDIAVKSNNSKGYLEQINIKPGPSRVGNSRDIIRQGERKSQRVPLDMAR